MEIKFCYPMFACEESGKACEESSKACEGRGTTPCRNTSEPPFWKRIFALLKMVYQDIVEAFFKRKALEVNANFCVFESQCPKIMVLSKTLKAKLLSIPSGVTSLLTPSLDWLSEKTIATMASFNHLLWRQLPHTQGPIRGPSLCVYVCASHEASGALSLIGGRQVHFWHYGKNLDQILRDYQR